MRILSKASLILLAVAGMAGGVMAQLAPAAARAKEPARLSKTLGLPAWLDLTGTHRTRYETLDGQFRAGRTGGDQMLAFRTTLRADVKFDRAGVTGEWIDSRQAWADAGTPIDSTMVNTLELLQGYGVLRWDGPLIAGSESEIRLGRQTIDLGSRRLVARNAFRNTINSFTGAHGRWQIKDGPEIMAFYVLPVMREPSDAASLLENEAEFDDESFGLQFWGIHLQWPRLLWGAAGEVYLLGLHEDDSSDRPTRNRQLYTPGLRLFRAPSKGAWDVDFESVVQLGTTRGSLAAADTRDLTQVAHFHHAEAGYTFDQAWSPRVAVLYDYASGDESAGDDESNRFDTLFGARRFDHGPTGIWGAFARGNIQSPGYSVSAAPAPPVRISLAHRPYWLASDTDAWTASGLRDASGQSGSFVGHQLEASVRWDVFPGNVRLEAGGARLFAGEFIKNAPNATGQGDSTYGYLALELRF